MAVAKESEREKRERLLKYSERQVILTLDLGAKTGWAMSSKGILSGGDYSKSGLIDLQHVKHKGERYFEYQWHIRGLFFDIRPSFIAYEKIERHAGVYAAHAYGAYQATVLAVAYDCGVPVVTMSVGEIKKFITGKGNADKQMVIDAVNKRGHNITDDNEADAVAMMYLQLSKLES